MPLHGSLLVKHLGRGPMERPVANHDIGQPEPVAKPSRRRIASAVTYDQTDLITVVDPRVKRVLIAFVVRPQPI